VDIEQIEALVPVDGLRVGREAFTDEQIFELEMRHIFEASWIYMCHESQIARPNDFVTGHIGRHPVIINRGRQGEIGGLVNACAHRGATVCREKRGNRAVFTCPFHGWCYNSSGELIAITDEEGAGYPDDFDRPAHGLKRVPRVASYRGFVFASLKEDVPSLEDYLDGAAWFIDLIVDQAPHGIEVLRGRSTYVYHGNWKLQAENGADAYHVNAVHSNYLSVVSRRKSGASKTGVQTMSPGGMRNQRGGFYAFRNGHIVAWSERATPETGPNFPMGVQYRERYGEERAFWMLGRSRNLCLYPNIFLMDSMSTQIRHWRPLSVDATEVTSYCYAPVGEPAESRAKRIRQFEDFYNASGMATPDDLAEFRAQQEGYGARLAPWNDLSRGAAQWTAGPDALAARSGFSAVMSGPRMDGEGLFLTQHLAWKERLIGALRAGR